MKRIIESKKILLPLLLGSVLGVVLRLWTRSGGPDAVGLFENNTLAWVLLWLVTAGVGVFCLLSVRELQNPGSYDQNYPASGLAAIFAFFVAVSFCVSGYQQLRDSVGLSLPGTTIVDTLTGIMALVAGVCLLLSAVHRLLGRKPFFLINGLVCLYLAFRLFNCCRIWSNQPQMGIFVFPFLASISLMLSAYQRVSFDVDMANRSRCAFWSMMSVYLCVVAVFSYENSLFYLLCALWQLADICALGRLEQEHQEIPEPQEIPETETIPETPEGEE